MRFDDGPRNGLLIVLKLASEESLYMSGPWNAPYQIAGRAGSSAVDPPSPPTTISHVRSPE